MLLALNALVGGSGERRKFHDLPDKAGAPARTVVYSIVKAARYRRRSCPNRTLYIDHDYVEFDLQAAIQVPASEMPASRDTGGIRTALIEVLPGREA